MKCVAVTRDGNPCRASALRGKRKCALHGIRGLARALGQRGGSRRARAQNLGEQLLQMPAPTTMQDARLLLGESLRELRAGKLPPKIAHAVSTLAGVFLRAAELGDLELRVSALEGRSVRGEKNVRPN
jgi:hypothetical protein